MKAMLSARRSCRQRSAGRVLPFGTAAAAACGPWVASQRLSGRPVSQFDAQVAAIAVSRQVGPATCNIAALMAALPALPASDEFFPQRDDASRASPLDGWAA